MPSLSFVQSPRAQPIKQLRAARAREMLPAPTALGEVARAATMRTYVSLYEAHCRYRNISHMRHRHALYLMCQGASPMRALVQSGLAGGQVAMLLPALYDRGAPGAMQWLTHLDRRLAWGQRIPAFKRRPDPDAAISPAHVLPPARTFFVLPLPRRSDLPAPQALQSGCLAVPTSVRVRAQTMWEMARLPGPRRTPSAEQRRDFIALVAVHLAVCLRMGRRRSYFWRCFAKATPRLMPAI